MNPRNRGFHLVDLPDNLAHHQRGMNKNICWSPDAFQEQDIDSPLVYRPSRLMTNPENDRAGTTRESTSTSTSSIFDLEVHSDSTLYSHASLVPNPNPNQSSQPSKAQHKTGKKALGFLRNSGGSQHQEDSNSRNSNDDLLHWNSKTPSTTSGSFPVIPAAPSFQSIFSTNSPSNSNKTNNGDQYDSSSFDTMDGRVLMEDWLQKRSSSLQLVWRRRWCVLKDGCLFYYRSNMETKPIGILNLADYALLTSGPDLSRRSKLAFRLSLTASPLETRHENVPTRTASSSTPAPPTRSSGGLTTSGSQEMSQHHLFHAETQEALDLWVDLIQTCIELARERQEDAIKKIGSNSRACSLDQASCLTYGYRSQFNPDQRGGGAQTAQQEGRTIIDKVLDRLLLEDPTLSDMNDPSTLIMPTQEQPSSGTSIRSFQMCVDDNLDAWSATSSSFLYSRHKDKSNDGSHGFPTPPRGGQSLMTDAVTSNSTSISGVAIGDGPQAVNRHGQRPTEEQLMYTGSSYSSSVHSQSAASSYAGVLDIRKKHRPSSVTSSSSGTVQDECKGHPSTLQTPGSSMIAHRGLPPLPSISTANPPISMSKGGPFSSPRSFAATSLTSPEYYILEVDQPYQDRGGSLVSISTSGSSSSGGSFLTPTTLENGMTLGEEEKNSYRGSSVHYGAHQDLSTAVIMEREAKAAVAMTSSPKKIKKLWSVYGTTSNPNLDSSVLKSEPTASTSKSEGDFADQSSISYGSKIGNNNTTKRSMTKTSQALDASNPLLRGLVLVAPTPFYKKSGNPKSNNSVKGNSFSKSMTSLSSKDNSFSDSGAHQVPVPPRILGTRSSSSSFVNTAPKAKESPSSSVKNEKHQPQNRQHSMDSTRTRSNTTNAISSRGVAHTAPISYIPNDWTAKEGSERHALYHSTQIRCVDPDILASALSLSFHTQDPNSSFNKKTNPFGAGISRQIVPTDELVMAIAQEAAAEELLKRQAELKKDSNDNDRESIDEKSRTDQIMYSGTVAAPKPELFSFAPAIPARSPHREPVSSTLK